MFNLGEFVWIYSHPIGTDGWHKFRSIGEEDISRALKLDLSFGESQPPYFIIDGEYYYE